MIRKETVLDLWKTFRQDTAAGIGTVHKAHELAHRAQMFSYLRLKDIGPAATRRRLAKLQNA